MHTLSEICRAWELAPILDVSELRTQKITWCAQSSNLHLLDYQQHVLKDIQALAEQTALVGKRNALLRGSTKPEEPTGCATR